MPTHLRHDLSKFSLSIVLVKNEAQNVWAKGQHETGSVDDFILLPYKCGGTKTCVGTGM